MVDLLKSLSDTPIPTILIVAGLLFLLLAIADKVRGEFRVSEKNRKYALATGVVLVVVGIGVSLKDFSQSEPKPQKDLENHFGGV